jgi:hypothetical protein
MQSNPNSSSNALFLSLKWFYNFVVGSYLMSIMTNFVYYRCIRFYATVILPWVLAHVYVMALLVKDSNCRIVIIDL